MSADTPTQNLAAEISRLNERLAHGEAVFAAVFEHVPYPVALMEVIEGRSYRPIASNAATLRMLGMSREERAAKAPSFSPDTASAILDRLNQCIAKGATISFNEHLVLADHEIWTQALYTPVPNAGGPHPWVTITSFDITPQKLREQAELREREAVIQRQSLVLDELSTPLLAISDRVVVMPLVGTIDSRRSQQIIASLLEGIALNGADVAIIDITGVALVDTQVANALLQAAQAVKLLGTRVILTGIRPEVAQTLVGLGVDLSAIITRNTLQSGIAEALRR